MKLNRPKIKVYDIDGTLVDVSSVRHHVVSGIKEKNFDKFHRASVDCPPIDWVVEDARKAKAEGYGVFQVTARDEQYRSLTSWWLAEHEVPSDKLEMRPLKDQRADYLVKRDIVNRLLLDYDIVEAHDDNPNIWVLWEEFDIPCVKVPGWVEVEEVA